MKAFWASVNLGAFIVSALPKPLEAAGKLYLKTIQFAGSRSLSRSAFFTRFTRTLGLPPMEYLLTWRMALAKRLLRTRELGLDQVAERVGYGSASAFSVAFARHAGMPPARYARMTSVA